jgi:hypothetical protein
VPSREIEEGVQRRPVAAIASQIAGFKFNRTHTYPLTTNAFAHITALTNARSK